MGCPVNAYRDGDKIIAPRRAEGTDAVGDAWVTLEPGTPEYDMWDQWLKSRPANPDADQQ